MTTATTTQSLYLLPVKVFSWPHVHKEAKRARARAHALMDRAPSGASAEWGAAVDEAAGPVPHWEL